MIRVKAILSFNDVMGVSESLKKIGIGGLTVNKERGRGKELLNSVRRKER